MVKPPLHIAVTLLLFLSGVFIKLQAQQDFVQTQYMFNLFSINPAYAGSRNTIDVNLSNRSQWTSIEGAPTTQVLSLHAPLFQKKIGLGLQVFNDKIGPRQVTGLTTSYAYHLRLGKGKLGLGLRAGAFNYSYDWNMLNYEEQNDIVIGNDKPSLLVVNFDFGAYYKDRLNYAGLEIAHLNQAELGFYKTSSDNIAHLYPSISLFYGHAFELNDNLALKTSILARSVVSSFFADLNASMLIKKLFWIGASYKTVGIVSAITKINATKKLSIGYSFDYPLASKFSNATSHEFFVQFRFNAFKNDDVSPRYF